MHALKCQPLRNDNRVILRPFRDHAPAGNLCPCIAAAMRSAATRLLQSRGKDMNGFGGTSQGNRHDALSASVRGCLSDRTEAMSIEPTRLRGVPCCGRAVRGSHVTGHRQNQFMECAGLSMRSSYLSMESANLPIGPHDVSMESTNPSISSSDLSMEGANLSMCRSNLSMENANSSMGSAIASIGKSNPFIGKSSLSIGKPDPSIGRVDLSIGSCCLSSKNVDLADSPPRQLMSMQARSHAPGAGSHAGSPPPGMRSTVFR
jgi:hypothetical protein